MGTVEKGRKRHDLSKVEKGRKREVTGYSRKGKEERGDWVKQRREGRER
jgi:hypothetical protein